ncbi:MAG: LysR family transcriptional regulator [Rhodobacteraceae bacterium]|nr:LysR family transcriptional regulator [Paracoccaceae bacterium]
MQIGDFWSLIHALAAAASGEDSKAATSGIAGVPSNAVAAGVAVQSLSGSLVITAPQLLIGPHLAPVLDQFCSKHGDVNPKVHETSYLLVLNRRAADLAIRISHSPGDSLTGLRRCDQESARFSSADVARRIRKEPDVWHSAKVAAFRDILVPHFRAQRACFVA